MEIYDKSNSLDSKFIRKMNVKLTKLGMPQWEEVKVSTKVKELSKWLDDAWQSDFPMLQDLLDQTEDATGISYS